MRRPHGVSWKQRRCEAGALMPMQDSDVAQDLDDVEHSLESLLMDIQDVDIDELPRPLQHHVFGVPARLCQLLRKLAREVVAYHEHRP